jgi:hypothetical protein
MWEDVGMRPALKFTGGVVLFLVDGTLQFSTHYQTLAFLQSGFPDQYKFLTGRPVAVSLLLVPCNLEIGVHLAKIYHPALTSATPLTTN